MNDMLIDEGLAVLASEPLPGDAFERLTALEAQAPKDPRWADIWEGFIAAGGTEPA